MKTNDRFLVTDETNDRKYFTIVPNYILDNLNIYECAVYVLIKRIAGDTGSCWVSAKKMAEKIGINNRTVLKARKSLLEKGLVKLVGKRGKTHLGDEFKVIDIWQKNMSFYNKKR